MMTRETELLGGHRNRVGVIDIGSNSIRLVVYNGIGRQPFPIFNEKVLCGLGRSLQATGRLDPEGRAMAEENLLRFHRLSRGMGVERLFVVATAAVRDAADGAEFVEDLHTRCNLAVRVLSGADEARLAALGLISGLPGASGVVGDLGGGSLELIDVENGIIRAQETLPLGPLRLMAAPGGKGTARTTVRDALATLPWLSGTAGRTFFPIGGAWRSLAKVHMAKAKHPLRVIHELTVPAVALHDLANLISRQGKASLDRLPGVSKRRLDTLPYASLVLSEVLERMQPERVVFSAYGLREGLLFDQLTPEEQTEDPLIVGCRDVARRIDRFGPEAAIDRWTQGLAALIPERLDRLRRAVCLLSDIGWSEHPDYRAEHAAMRVLRLPVGGLTHEDRAFMAMAIAVRYGAVPTPANLSAITLLDADTRNAATLVGLTLRLAHTLSGGVPLILETAWLDVTGDPIVLSVSDSEGALMGEVVRRRLDAVAKALGRGADVQTARLADRRLAGG
ncbi:MAG: Ppx/GppA family phosphatase [Rhodospirillaceae bacterium]|nr:Ppx/GppA family phosphatase [Rhodospirillaceae bacterium]MCA8931399.1 Ppx/GppA family phosphatase [Rhodospirillaceae bacterium]